MIPSLLLVLVPLQAGSPEKVPQELARELALRPAETHRVYAVLDERLGLRDLLPEAQKLPRGERQLFVADRLRAFADARQGNVLALLDELAAEGEVERVRQLWIANAVVFHGTAAAIDAVAALPEVERIGWDPVRDPSIYHDVAPAPPPARGGTIYYSTGFESGLPPEFSVATTGCGFADVTSQYGPKTGSAHLVMASTTDSCDSTAKVTLALDLTGVTTAKLRFAFKDMNDEFDPGQDVLEASDDGGATWVKVADLTGADGIYVVKTFDLDPLGLTYGPNFLVRWSWKDNFAPQTDGFGIDDLEIGDLPPPPPPTPEPNLVQLQAPALWDLGFDGSGVVILNIDSGTERTHPDLVNRIWTNPLDPLNGIDDDGNGFVDDTWGWDFDSNDNDPSPSGSHGTQTAGIMVGDGASGIAATGMAPGASLAVAKINGETDHWAAQQWGISVAIDCSSSSHSYKWFFSPKPDYHVHRTVEDMVLAAGIIHANSIGNNGGSTSAPVPFQISAPGLSPSPWRHHEQTQLEGGVSGVMGCGGIELDDSFYSLSSHGPSAWENIGLYDGGYPHPQAARFWDYPFGGFGGGQQGLLKPDVVAYTNVQTTTTGGGYSSFGGTSAATPHLGGAMALLISAQPAAEPRHVAQALQVTAVDLGASGKDGFFGAGKIQVLEAAFRLLHLLKVDDPTPSIGSTVNFSAHGAPGAAFAAFWSPNLGTTPTPFGDLDIAAPLHFLTGGNLDGSGTFQVPVPIPNDPGLVGVDVHVQSGADDTGGTTGQFLFSTVETVRAMP